MSFSRREPLSGSFRSLFRFENLTAHRFLVEGRSRIPTQDPDSVAVYKGHRALVQWIRLLSFQQNDSHRREILAADHKISAHARRDHVFLFDQAGNVDINEKRVWAKNEFERSKNFLGFCVNQWSRATFVGAGVDTLLFDRAGVFKLLEILNRFMAEIRPYLGKQGQFTCLVVFFLSSQRATPDKPDNHCTDQESDTKKNQVPE